MFECLEKVIIFCERLASSSPRHVKCTVIHLLPPVRYRLLLLVADVGVDESLELFVRCYLPSIFKSVSGPQILIYIFYIDRPSILVVHYQSANYILGQWFRDKSLSISCSENSLSCLLLLLPLFLTHLLCNLLKILTLFIRVPSAIRVVVCGLSLGMILPCWCLYRNWNKFK